MKEHLLTTGQVAAMFGVDPRTVVRWSQAGMLPAIKTLGGHRRFFEADVLTAKADFGTWDEYGEGAA